jgi:molybdate-binding protein/DNA-binding XRE family transcriptional regulator
MKSYTDTIMSTSNSNANRVREQRLSRQWSQAELAARAGISRAAVSAIEGERLVPSVAAALSLASVFECSVEDLFGANSETETSTQWAWPPTMLSGGRQSPGFAQASGHIRYWSGTIQGRTFFYPVEATPLGELPHDGVADPSSASPLAVRTTVTRGQVAARHRSASQTLIMAGCDPAAGLLARLYEQASGYRMLVFSRSSRQALELLQQGLVHVAGVHLASSEEHDGNAAPVRKILSQPAKLLRVTEWEDGIALGSGLSAVSSVRAVLRNRLTWIGREPGSGARQCLDELLDDRPAPRRIARDHRGVAEAVRCGWADAGVCLRLVAEEAGLRFLPIRTEGYDLCFTQIMGDDPRVQALIRVLQSQEYRLLIGDLPGYETRRAGELQNVD